MATDQPALAARCPHGAPLWACNDPATAAGLPVVTTAEAERRYHYDATFHAKVHAAVNVLDLDLRGRTGRRMTDEDRSLAALAAAVAVLVAEVGYA
jgi:hypothetical protein